MSDDVNSPMTDVLNIRRSDTTNVGTLGSTAMDTDGASFANGLTLPTYGDPANAPQEAG